MKEIKLKKIKLTKIKELEDAVVPGNIDEGFEKIGILLSEPVKGECFWVGTSFRTSLVTEVLENNTFKTMNSIYKYEFID